MRSSPAPDFSSVDGIVNALYRAVSGPKGEKHDWSLMRSLFLPTARLGWVSPSTSGKLKYDSCTVAEYIKNTDKFMTEQGYFESERKRHVERFGEIAQVFSSYDSRASKSNPKPQDRGINSLQLISDGRRWWVSSIQWRQEDPHLKLPSAW